MTPSPQTGTGLPEMPVIADPNQTVVTPEQGRVQPDALTPDLQEEAEVLQASIKAGSVAQIVVAVIAVIGLIYLLKFVLITTLVSVLLAFVLEPVVSGLSRIRVPRRGWSSVRGSPADGRGRRSYLVLLRSSR